jgi:uncharacterized protein YndB with AHSA1/START domain
MKYNHTLQLKAVGETDLVISRSFDAPKEMVFDAFTKPELIRRWLLGPPGWTMPVCEVDLRVGGKFRYVWRKNETDMGMGGTYIEISKPDRLVHSELFDTCWYPGEATISNLFTQTGNKTELVTTARYESREARDTVMNSEMEKGLSASYDRLEELLSAK